MSRFLRERELLDIPDSATPSEIEGNLMDIAKANKWLGGTSLILFHLSRMIRLSGDNLPIRVLDLGTGYADIPVAIVRWARKRRIDISITAVDINPTVVQIATEKAAGYPEIHVERQDILNLPYDNDNFHYAICSQVIHHLDDESVIRVLREANRLACCGLVISDLRRSAVCIWMASIAARLMRNRLTAHDVRVSLQNAFTIDEITELAERAELPPWRIFTYWPCRLALVVDKRNIEWVRESGRSQSAQAITGGLP